jgi:hypothetical protein
MNVWQDLGDDDEEGVGDDDPTTIDDPLIPLPDGEQSIYQDA